MTTVRTQITTLEGGRVHKVYADPLTGGAPWTVGIGHTGPEVKQGDTWTDAQIDAAFEADMQEATNFCTKQVVGFNAMNEPRQAVLIGMAFQMGSRRLLGFRNMLAAVAAGNYFTAARQMQDSAWARQTPKRVAILSRQMETGAWQ